MNLKRRTITKDDLCSECGKEPESNCHIFWFCDKVKDIWGNSMLVFPFHMESWWSFMDVVWQIVQCRLCDSSLLETTMTLCWEIWKSRNSVRHGGPYSSGKSIVQRALALMQEYRVATEIVHSPRPTEAVKWHPPDHPLRDRLVCTSTFSSHVFLFFFFFFPAHEQKPHMGLLYRRQKSLFTYCLSLFTVLFTH